MKPKSDLYIFLLSSKKHKDMDPTLIYNGYHLQRKKLYPNNPRNNLVSQIDLQWRDSLFEEEMSPTLQILKKKEKERQYLAEQYSKTIERKVEKDLNIRDSRTYHKTNQIENQEEQNKSKISRYNSNNSNHSDFKTISFQYKNQAIRSENTSGKQSFSLLPKIKSPMKQTHSILDEVFTRRSLDQKRYSYFTQILQKRLEKYNQLHQNRMEQENQSSGERVHYRKGNEYV